jgi:crossover junction endodeoxyribonuclease RuvC
VKIFGIDPGSERTGYGCIETDGSRHRLIACGVISTPSRSEFSRRLLLIYDGLRSLLDAHRPDAVAVEDVFHARNVRSALKLGQARGVALLAATQTGVPVVAYSPAEVKGAVVGYGRAEKRQVQQMVSLLLGLTTAPTPYDASDALAIAICHMHSSTPAAMRAVIPVTPTLPRTWRRYDPTLHSAKKLH